MHVTGSVSPDTMETDEPTLEHVAELCSVRNMFLSNPRFTLVSLLLSFLAGGSGVLRLPLELWGVGAWVGRCAGHPLEARVAAGEIGQGSQGEFAWNREVFARG